MVTRDSSKQVDGTSIVPLTGGFGNQLFQLAFGLFLEEQTGRRTIFDQDIGRPRKTGLNVSLMGISTTEYTVSYRKHRPRLLSKLYSKAFGWNLSKFLSYQNRSFGTLIIKVISRILLSISSRRFIKIVVSTDLGFDPSLDLSKQGIYIGYFQTSVYATSPKIFDRMNSIKPVSLSAKYSRLLREIEETTPLLLHIRLTDYLQEEKFGVPTCEYYQDSFDRIVNLKKFSNIWIFSDDPNGAKKLLKKFKSNLEMSFLDQHGLSDIEVWSLMRYFKGYIIANSSFSWWGAFLRIDKSAPVCVPKPWFEGMRNPNQLIPAEWIQVERR